MERDERIKRLRSLSPRQREVFRMFCNGSDYASIADKMVITEGGVRAHMANIYTRLGLPELKQQERWKEIFQYYCPLVDEIGFVEAIGEPEPEEEPGEVIPEKVKKILDEDQHALVLVGPTVIKPPEEPKQQRRRGCLLPIVGTLAIVVLAVLALNWLGLLDINGVIANEEPTSTQEQVAFEQAATEAPASETSPPRAIATEALPTSTFQPSITPRPTEIVLFEDNFETGLSPQWQLVYCNPLVVNGMLTADRDTVLLVGDSSWTDYQIDFDADAADCWFSWSSNYLGVRVNNADNMIAYKWADCESYWYVVKNGSWQEVPASEFGPGYEMLHFTIKVQGSELSVYVDGLKESSFINTEFTQGKLYLAIAADTLIENFMVRPVID